MRRRYREKKAQEEKFQIVPEVEEEVDTLDEADDAVPAKSGDSSEVFLSGLSYHYEKGSKYVSFSCESLENISEEATGLLLLYCWISEKTRDNGEWQNDNFAYADCCELGVLEADGCFPDIKCTFEIPDNLLEVINNLNEDGDEWHFIFTVNEQHEDGNKYIIHTVNGDNVNEDDDDYDDDDYDEWIEATKKAINLLYQLEKCPYAERKSSLSIIERISPPNGYEAEWNQVLRIWRTFAKDLKIDTKTLPNPDGIRYSQRPYPIKGGVGVQELIKEIVKNS